METASTPVTIPRDAGDDPDYIAIVQHMLTHFLRAHAPDDVFVLRVDTWFGVDHIPAATPDGETRLPPFRAEHVISEARYEKDETGAYPERALPRPIHVTRADAARQKMAEAWTESGLFLWYSGGSTTNRRGSAMVLEMREGKRGVACIKFGKNGAWRISHAHGLTPEEAETACGLRR